MYFQSWYGYSRTRRTVSSAYDIIYCTIASYYNRSGMQEAGAMQGQRTCIGIKSCEHHELQFRLYHAHLTLAMRARVSMRFAVDLIKNRIDLYVS